MPNILPSPWPSSATKIEFTHADETSQLQLKRDDSVQKSLSDICKEATPDCWLNPFLFNGHLQTGWTMVDNDGPPVRYKRRVFVSGEKEVRGSFAVDFALGVSATSSLEDTFQDDELLLEDPTGVGHHFLPPRTTYFTDEEFESLGSDDDKPLVIVLHGLSGGSYEGYLRHVLGPLVKKAPNPWKGFSDGVWDALVVNSRGCAGSKITSNYLYNARATWDIRQVVHWARQQWPKRPLFGVGFSLGANIITNYIAEEGENCLLKSAVVASNPWNLEISAKALQRTWLGLEVYSKVMGRNMRNLAELHRNEICAESHVAVDIDKVCRGKYLHQFDRDLQCAVWGYPTEDTFYRDTSCCDSVLGIRIPFFALHAKDDPISPDEAVPYQEIKQNPYVVLCTTSRGGHLSWFELGGGRWYSKSIEAFLNIMANDIDFTSKKRPSLQHFSRFKSPFSFDPLARKGSSGFANGYPISSNLDDNTSRTETDESTSSIDLLSSSYQSSCSSQSSQSDYTQSNCASDLEVTASRELSPSSTTERKGTDVTIPEKGVVVKKRSTGFFGTSTLRPSWLRLSSRRHTVHGKSLQQI